MHASVVAWLAPGVLVPGAMIDSSTTVATAVLDHSECAEVFHRHRIDFCCRGNITIDAAARERGLETSALLAELASAIARRQGAAAEAADPRTMSTPRLISHIIATHHEYLRTALPFITTIATKVGRVHGDRDERLLTVAGLVEELGQALLPHLDDEEQDLFPAMMVRTPDAPKLASAITAMWDDHRAVGELLAQLRDVTDDFQTPDWACKSYRTLFSELQQLERDVLTHVHLENHVLAPRFA